MTSFKKIFFQLILTIGFILISLWSFTPLAIAASSWTTGVVEDDLNVDNAPRGIVRDSNGDIHVVYGGDRLYHAVKATGSTTWQIETINNETSVGQVLAIAIDGRDWIHVAYYDQLNQILKYALYYENDGIWKWASDTLDSSAKVGSYIAIAADTSNRIHIAYFDETNTSLKYLLLTDTSRTTTTFDDAGDAGYYPAMTVDSAGTVHLIYYSSDGTTFKRFNYATCSLSQTLPQVIGYPKEFLSGLSQVSIAVDSTGKIHLIYNSSKSMAHSYSTDGGQTWHAATFTSISLTYSSAQIDPSNNSLNVVFQDASSSQLKYAQYVDQGSSGWQWQGAFTIDSDHKVDRFPAMVTGTNKDNHIVYYDDDNDDIRYINYQYLSGTSELMVDGDSTKVGPHLSLDFDSSGRPHVAYYDSATKSLKYAYLDQGIWQISALNSSNTTGEFSSTAQVGQYVTLMMDSQDIPHLIFYDATNKHLKYAKYQTEFNNWDVSDLGMETIAGTEEVGKYASAIMDKSDNIYVIYYYHESGSTSYSLKYLPKINTMWQCFEDYPNCAGTIASGLPTQGNTAISVDASGAIHVVYPSSDSMLVYATSPAGATGTWVAENVAKGLDPDIAMDSSNRPHVIYSVNSSYVLKHAVRDASSWTIETVADQLGVAASIAIDGSDNVHVAFKNTSGDGLGNRYTLKSAQNGTWSTSIIENDITTGNITSLALGNYGDVHVAYQDAGLQAIKYSSLDADGDGYLLPEDCNDTSDVISPSATEICDDGIDNDCNGSDKICGDIDMAPIEGSVTDDVDDSVDVDGDEPDSALYDDEDGDGFCAGTRNEAFSSAKGGVCKGFNDCDDANPYTTPDTEDVSVSETDPTAAYTRGIDNDCDGQVDEDSIAYKSISTSGSLTQGALAGGCSLTVAPTTSNASPLLLLSMPVLIGWLRVRSLRK